MYITTINSAAWGRKGKKMFNTIHDCKTPAEREAFIADLWNSAIITTDEYIAMIECERSGTVHKNLR